MTDAVSSRRKEGVKPATLSDVAAKAGVSVGTVSNVLNRPEKVMPPRRHAVWSAINELDYRRNEHAAALRMGDTSQREAATRAEKCQDPRRNNAEVEVEPQHTRRKKEARNPLKIHKFPVAESDELNWYRLRPGSAVEVRFNEQEVFAGEVDMIMNDRSAVWIWVIGVGRRLIHVDDGAILVERKVTR
ncbi:LacI family DNA-binding transcriptional regulator [Arthrobacter sp. D2-10]